MEGEPAGTFYKRLRRAGVQWGLVCSVTGVYLRRCHRAQPVGEMQYFANLWTIEVQHNVWIGQECRICSSNLLECIVHRAGQRFATPEICHRHHGPWSHGLWSWCDFVLRAQAARYTEKYCLWSTEVGEIQKIITQKPKKSPEVNKITQKPPTPPKKKEKKESILL